MTEWNEIAIYSTPLEKEKSVEIFPAHCGIIMWSRKVNFPPDSFTWLFFTSLSFSSQSEKIVLIRRLIFSKLRKDGTKVADTTCDTSSHSCYWCSVALLKSFLTLARSTFQGFFYVAISTMTIYLMVSCSIFYIKLYKILIHSAVIWKLKVSRLTSLLQLKFPPNCGTRVIHGESANFKSVRCVVFFSFS